MFFPLLGVALTENQIAEAAEYAQLLLNPMQMILPEDLNATLEKAIQLAPQDAEAARTLFTEAIRLATGYGYL